MKMKSRLAARSAAEAELQFTWGLTNNIQDRTAARSAAEARKMDFMIAIRHFSYWNSNLPFAKSSISVHRDSITLQYQFTYWISVHRDFHKILNRDLNSLSSQFTEISIHLVRRYSFQFTEISVHLVHRTHFSSLRFQFTWSVHLVHRHSFQFTEISIHLLRPLRFQFTWFPTGIHSTEIQFTVPCRCAYRY